LGEPMRKFHYDLYSRSNQKIIDALITGISLCLAYQIRFEWRVPSVSAYQFWLLLPAVMLGRVLLNWLLGTYRMIWRYIGLADAVRLSRNYFVFSLFLLGLRLGLPAKLAILRLPLSIIVLEFVLSLEGAVGVRSLRRLLSEKAVARTFYGRPGTKTLLVGAGDAGARVAKELALRPDLSPVGFLDDDPKKIGTVINGLQVLGPLASLEAAVVKHQVEEVVVCLAQPPRELLKRVWAYCEALAVRVKLVPTLDEILEGRVSIAAFRNVEMSDLLGRDPVNLSFDDTDVPVTYKGKRILITGAGGSIGSELAYQLAKLKPAQIVLLDKDENGLNDAYLRIEADSGGAAVSPVVADLRFPERVDAIFSTFRPEVVFHAAAHKHVHLMEMNPCEAILNNVVGTRNLVERSAAFGASRFVLVSTDKAVKPTSIMGASKRVCELIVQAQQNGGLTRFCCVRFGNVLGSRGSVIPIFRSQIAHGGPVTVTDADAQRFLMTIPEAVFLLIQAGTLASSGEIFVLDMGKPIPIQSLARNLIELSGLQPGRDIRIQITKLRRGEKLSEALIDESTEDLRPTRFDKVRVINTQPFGSTGLEQRLRALEEAARGNSPPDIYRALREINIGFHTPQAEPSRLVSEPAPAQASLAAAKG
jgi:FlaA1/EpsC-like NDP-sugar epimerase